MSQQTATQQPALTNLQVIKQFFDKDSVKAKFSELVGKKSNLFVASVMQVVANNSYLKNVSADSVYQSAYMAAVLDLPINNNLGRAYMVPYGGVAQFQIGWKGFVELGIRSGFYKKIKPTIIYENMFVSWDEVEEELIYNKNVRGAGKIVGYYAMFELLNGFRKCDFWFYDEVYAHGEKYSKAFKKSDAPWVKEFDEMALKTVLKNILSKFGPMSIEMQKAFESDQAIIVDAETGEYSWEDNPESDGIKPDEIKDDFTMAMEAVEAAESKEKLQLVMSTAKSHRFNKEQQTKYYAAIKAKEDSYISHVTVNKNES